MKIDWNFKQSLIMDILKGLSYLHNAAMMCHGNMKSSNCVVDSRFVLKLTDFGLLAVRNNQELDRFLIKHCDAFCPDMFDIHFRESYEYNKSKLWTAPEYLREEDRVFSRPGDIYSLGVILHEIIERAGVWALNTNTNEDDDEDYLEPKVRVRENFEL